MSIRDDIALVLAEHEAELMPAREDRFAVCDCGWEGDSHHTTGACYAEHRLHVADCVIDVLSAS